MCETDQDLSVDASSATSLLKFIKIKEVLHTVKKTWNKYCSKPRVVVIYGESGVGKSQFLNTILNNGIITESRTNNRNKLRLELSDGHKIDFIDTPGHKSLQFIRKELNKEFAKGKIYGVINVVDYGYMSTPTLKRDEVFRAGTNEVKQEFLRDNRKREIQQIEEWVDLIDKDSNVKWFMTVVNKADVWFEDYDEVIEYYASGDYYKEVKTLSHCCHVVCYPFCSIMTPYCGEPMLLSMSEKDKRRMHKSLYDELLRLTFEE